MTTFTATNGVIIGEQYGWLEVEDGDRIFHLTPEQLEALHQWFDRGARR